MKPFVKFLLLLSFIFASGSLIAHQPDLSSTMLVQQADNVWVLQIRAALTGFEYEVDTHFGEDSFATPEEFQDLVLQHVLKNLTIRANEGNVLGLENGRVKLGHETSVTFEVKGMPETIDNLEVKNSSFKDIARNQSALILLKNGVEKKQFTLNKHNAHTAKLGIKDAKFVLLNSVAKDLTNSNNSKYIYLGAIAIGALFLFLIIYKISKNK